MALTVRLALVAVTADCSSLRMTNPIPGSSNASVGRLLNRHGNAQHDGVRERGAGARRRKSGGCGNGTAYRSNGVRGDDAAQHVTPATSAVAVVDAPAPVSADATEVSTTPVDMIGGRLTFATLLLFVIPAVSVQRTVAAEGPELAAADPTAAEIRVP
jgi:hypothetical protein